MSFLKNKLSSLKTNISESVDKAKNQVSDAVNDSAISSASENLQSSVKDKFFSCVDFTKNASASATAYVSSKVDEIDFESMKTKEFYFEKGFAVTEFASSKMSSAFKSTFEVDQTTEEILNNVKGQLPVPASELSDIFEACKKEALQRAIAAFCLAPVMSGFDDMLEERFDNLSQSYKEFSGMHNVRSHKNYKKLENERTKASEEQFGLDDGYNSSNTLFPWKESADIEHIIPAKEIYNNWILRITSSNSEAIDSINFEDNLIFADSSLNSSKRDVDLLDYINKNGIRDEFNDDIIHFTINGKDVEISEKDALEKYETAKENVKNLQLNAFKEMGLTVASSATRIAVQQVVGLIIVETIDIFIDEIKDISYNCNLFDENGFVNNISQRKENIKNKLALRFQERQILKRAKELGIESGIAGALSIIPQILISILTRMPAFVLSMIRECTLSTVRCVRVLLDPTVDKYSSIKIIMAGTVTAVLGVYIARVISTAISGVPMLNAFNRQATEVLSAVFVTAIPLSAIYIFDKNKMRLNFCLKKIF